jgi:GxxExxY protein
MNADERRLLLDQITGKVVGAVHQVSSTLGVGFVEKVYENALVVELRELGMEVAQQHRAEVQYKNIVVGVLLLTC